MHSQFHLIVFYVVATVCFIPEWYGSVFRRAGKGAVSRDRGSLFWLLAAIGGGIFVAFFVVNANLPGTTLAWHQPVLFWAGIVLMVAGQAFRWYAFREQGTSSNQRQLLQFYRLQGNLAYVTHFDRNVCQYFCHVSGRRNHPKHAFGTSCFQYEFSVAVGKGVLENCVFNPEEEARTRARLSGR